MAKLCIIPARGGSKRIPKKNIKLFLGKPIIAYSIISALESNVFDEVMVSSDDDEILKIARMYGAKTPFKRSSKNADDFATTIDVIDEVLSYYENQGVFFETACCIYPTAPFVTKKTLLNALNVLITKKFDSVFPVIGFSFPIQRALKIDSQSKLSLFQPESIHKRSQDLEQAYHDAGQFYWFNPAIIKTKKTLWTDNSGVIIIKETEGQDIDTFEDWKLAELKYKLLHEEKNNL